MSIMFADCPCWYKLSWDSEQCAIIFSIHEVVFSEEGCLEKRIKPFAEYVSEKYKFLKFFDKLEEGLCFNKVFEYRGVSGMFHEFVVSLKNPPQPGKEICEKCLGHEADLFVNEACTECNGAGRKLELTYKKLLAISASFKVLLHWLKYSKFLVTSSDGPQLLLLEVLFGYGHHSSSLSGEYSNYLIKWLTDPVFLVLNRETVHLDVITKEMEKAYFIMRNKAKSTDYGSYFEFEVRKPGLIYISVPGDGCFIHPGSSAFDVDSGYQFTSHNVDSSIQQLTLLVGLACLCDLVIKN